MNNYGLIFLVFGIALCISYLLTPLMRRIALKNGILSRPGKRMVHSRSVPYLGGVAIYLAFMVSVLLIFLSNPQFGTGFSRSLKGLFIGSALIVILGLWDDIKGLRPASKLSLQIIIALVLFVYGFRIKLLTNPFASGEIYIPLPLSVLITVAWVVGLVNALNLIDGLDGLSAGITVIVSGSLLFIALFLGNYITVFLFAALAGSALGFLRFNFSPAKIFMGDAGSMFIGLVLASVTLMQSQYKSATAAALLVPITVLAIPIYDTLMAFFRRLLNRRSIFKADKRHLHHRLLSTGLKQKQIVLFMYLVTLYLGIFAFLFVLISEKYALILLALLALGLFMASRVIGFVEREARLAHRLELKRRKDEA
jgi:UDP-GlcNAc:undecaprenyl-phosphate GlcNAc-1-phosphate transferase